MSLLSTLLTLLLPLGVPSAALDDGSVVQQSEQREAPIPPGSMSRRTPSWTSFSAGLPPQTVRQVRIEGQMILRISPQPGPVRPDAIAELQARQAAEQVRIVERPMGDCIATSGIAGVSDRGSRLVFYMRDRSMVSAQLEKTCSPRDFYLGFYMERSSDGQICVDRDRLLSRAGARCQVSEFNRLMVLQARQ